MVEDSNQKKPAGPNTPSLQTVLPILNNTEELLSCRKPVKTSSYAEVAEGFVVTAAGEIPRVPAGLNRADIIGRWKARWGIGRMSYMVAPGLYAVGNPSEKSEVLVTANYKMSFDLLRSKLTGRDFWILVLDTRGINVWCAAGKGTFGTEELVARIAITRLSDIVSHRRLILPQLGAPGVSAHEIKDRTGFRVTYGPIRAGDLLRFIDNGMKADDEMRRVRFSFIDRIILIPVELVMSLKYFLGTVALLFVLSGVGPDIFSIGRVIDAGPTTALLASSGYLAGVALVPALLPWLPGRSFALKGVMAGLLAALIIGVLMWYDFGWTLGKLETLGWLLLIPAVASFIGMNFTGSSTYTSLSGVRKEMRAAVPIQVAGFLVGFGFWIASRFV